MSAIKPQCPLCALSGKQSEMKLAPKAIGRDYEMFCCVTCYVLMDAQEHERRWLELSAHIVKSDELKRLIDKFSR